MQFCHSNLSKLTELNSKVYIIIHNEIAYLCVKVFTVILTGSERVGIESKGIKGYHKYSFGSIYNLVTNM